MKTKNIAALLFAVSACALQAQSNNPNYTNFVRQVQLPYDGVQRDLEGVDATDYANSPLEINPYGARFELHTVRALPLQSFLLDTRYVGAYVPLAEVVIRSEDTTSPTPRTRADRPFYVDVTVNGLRNGLFDPVASKSVKFLRHTQSYGANGTGEGIDPQQATLTTQSIINKNSKEVPQTLTYTLTGIAGANRAKIRGEERFSVFTHDDFQAKSSQLASQTIQIWPVADGTISGITSGQTVAFTAPPLTIAVNDIYPGATIYAQVYKGAKRDGVDGTRVSGSGRTNNEAFPTNELLPVADWGSELTSDGTWTMELLTSTPFGIDRLAWVSFNVDRSISVNGSVTTIE